MAAPTIAITAPTGNVGRHLTGILVRAGVRPRVLVRDPGRLDPLLRDAVDAVTVDLEDADAVVAATRDVDGLYWVHPSPMTADPIATYIELGWTAARAVRENRIPRIAFQSSIGAEKRHGVGEIDGLGATEELLAAAAADAGAALLILRPGFFFSNLLMSLDDIRAGRTSVIVPVDAPRPWVAPRDIAEVAATRLLAGWEGQVIQAVHGPEDLSWARAAEIVVDAIGRPFEVQQIDDEAMRSGMLEAGLAPGLVEGLLGMSIGSRDDFVPEQPRDATTTTPTTLAAWAYEELRPLLTSAESG